MGGEDMKKQKAHAPAGVPVIPTRQLPKHSTTPPRVVPNFTETPSDQRHRQDRVFFGKIRDPLSGAKHLEEARKELLSQQAKLIRKAVNKEEDPESVEDKLKIINEKQAMLEQLYVAKSLMGAIRQAKTIIRLASQIGPDAKKDALKWINNEFFEWKPDLSPFALRQIKRHIPELGIAKSSGT
jgi:hypothetical protein